MEPNRIWHDPVVEIYSNLITPGVRYSAEAYDLANRRWDRLDITESEVPDDDWLSSTVADHIRTYYAVHKLAPWWNTISKTARDSPATFEARPDGVVSRPITLSWGTEPLFYGTQPTDKLPTTSIDELEQLTYISRSADRCLWRGQDCVFKRIEFNVGIKPITQEIRAREALIDATGPLPEGSDVNDEMVRRKPWEPGSVAGLLMPYCGPDLEMLVRDEEKAAALPVTGRQLRELVRGVKELGRCGVQHGDIKYWNTVFHPGSGDEKATLVLIDFDSEAPEYDGDAEDLGTLLLWCVDHAKGLRDDRGAKARVVAAAAGLRAEGDFDAAIACLSDHHSDVAGDARI
ncbi:hypothetical protein C8A03DRAFT_45427 [Achaetomium macrosporum]|uniref:Protein kinase domain-containing protein n=1 Tax=Achaetomium macrosporum TaxID=79813 RepID=A0AAN7C713_9PEZI|nr:hypothetical protein C8A03DRAFT_45427 [Achaetomium macrosporum]